MGFRGVLIAALLAPVAWAQPPEHAALVMETASGQHIEFQVEIADTPDERHQGLMSRRTLSGNAGMLFIFEQVRPVSMWMYGTLLSLDMLFIDESGRIVRVMEAMTPESTALIPSGEPVRAVLEINAGVCRRLGIRAGDQIDKSTLKAWWSTTSALQTRYRIPSATTAP
ncbi:MAG TPA: DUF192 domain-containing protein [Gammaproteobacteria bacterium]|nr:DUF192 domain-containing protein [Gammaproteobacteria bacterium]